MYRFHCENTDKGRPGSLSGISVVDTTNSGWTQVEKSTSLFLCLQIWLPTDCPSAALYAELTITHSVGHLSLHPFLHRENWEPQACFPEEFYFRKRGYFCSFSLLICYRSHFLTTLYKGWRLTKIFLGRWRLQPHGSSMETEKITEEIFVDLVWF